MHISDAGSSDEFPIYMGGKPHRTLIIIEVMFGYIDAVASGQYTLHNSTPPFMPSGSLYRLIMRML